MKTPQKIYAEKMLPHYLECAIWADPPIDDDGIETAQGLDFSPCAEELALADCMRFAGINWEMIKECIPEQVGHDLWLTRNRHGAGFWDRPEIYGGQENADALTESANSFGSRDIFEHNGRLIIE